MNKILPFALCVLLYLTHVIAEDLSPDQPQKTAAAEAASGAAEDLSRAKRNVDMHRLARGIHMLRLGKRQLEVLRLGKRPQSVPGLGKRQLRVLRLGKRDFDDNDLSDLSEAALNGQYYDDDDLSFLEPVHGRYRRSTDPSAESVPSGSLLADSKDDAPSSHVKRSAGFMDSPEDEEGFVGDEEGDSSVEKRPVPMLRMGKRPMPMLRLGKRPMPMLRLGKRPMPMLRLGKRPMPMLRLGKRPMPMLRLGKRPMPMLRLGKRPMPMLRLGKRPMPMLRLGKRDMPMLGLGDDYEEQGLVGAESFEPSLNDEAEFTADKRPMPMLRLGKRPMPMLRLGKRALHMLRLGKRALHMLRLGKRDLSMLRLGELPIEDTMTPYEMEETSGADAERR